MLQLKARLATVGLAATLAVGGAMISTGAAHASDHSTDRVLFKVFSHVFHGRGHHRHHHGRHYRHPHRHDGHHGRHHGFGIGHDRRHEGFLRHGRVGQYGRGHARHETCRRVFKSVYDDYGRRIRIAGTMCVNPYGNAYIVPGSRYVFAR